MESICKNILQDGKVFRNLINAIEEGKLMAGTFEGRNIQVP